MTKHFSKLSGKFSYILSSGAVIGLSLSAPLTPLQAQQEVARNFPNNSCAQFHNSLYDAKFDRNRPLLLEGEVVRFDWVSPFTLIYLDVVRNGQTERWVIEAGSPTALTRRGWRRNSLREGTNIIIEAFGAANGSNLATASEIRFPNGRQLSLGNPSPEAVQAARNAAQGQSIVVTGSRVQQRNYESNSPIVTISREDLERSPPPPPPPPAPPPAAARTGSVASSAGIVSLRGQGSNRRPVLSRHVPPIVLPPQQNREQYEGEEVSPIKIVTAEPVSTFSIDVDTGSYSNSRRFLSQGQLPPQEAVRTEEMINYFRYDYAVPEDRDTPFSVNTDMAVTPWNADTRLLRIGLRGYDLPREDRPPANLVFLMDVSGSMRSADKLPLVKTAMRQLAGELGEYDRVSIVVYAGAAGLVLSPTNDERQIVCALDTLRAGGSTAGGAGLTLAYNVAREHFIEDGVNRIILATDGDFNVGTTANESLVEMVERQAKSGITLTTLGFGQGNYNEAMMEQVADHGNGNYSYIDSALEARKVLSEEMTSTLFTIAHDVKIQVEFNPAQVSQYRLIGYENRALREEDFNNDKVDAGEIGAGHQVTAIYEIVPAGTDGWVSARRYETPAPSTRSTGSEVAFVKLRYKLPGQDSSRLIERPVSASMMANARAARGDMAFVSAVAAYGQLLRGDNLLGNFDFDDVQSLAGDQNGYWREEFLKLADIAETLDGPSSGG